MLFDVLNGLGLPFSFVTKLPLYSLGFAWVIPSVIGAVIGALIPEKTAVRTVPIGSAAAVPAAKEAS